MSDPLPPREWLLRRRSDRTRELDAIRQAALPQADGSSAGWRNVLVEIFRPHRGVWRALGAIWILLIAFQLTFSRAAPAPSTATNLPDAAAVIAWIRQLKSHETLAQMDR
jgi:hypothetical protein